MTRDKVIGEAIDNCLKEIYQYARPKVSWDDFIEQNKEYSKRYREWEKSEDRGNKVSCIGPAPYEFYYVPKDILKSICDSYVYAYRLDSQQNLLDIIEVLKEYCESPIVDKYIDDYTDEHGRHHPGYRGYDHPDNLQIEIESLLKSYYGNSDCDFSYVAEEIIRNFHGFMDMAGKFYNWNRDLNTFNMSVYLGPSPHSNKDTVIENWRKYRQQDIEIDEEEINREFYGEED